MTTARSRGRGGCLRPVSRLLLRSWAIRRSTCVERCPEAREKVAQEALGEAPDGHALPEEVVAHPGLGCRQPEGLGQELGEGDLENALEFAGIVGEIAFGVWRPGDEGDDVEVADAGVDGL